jgi:hypothetical protein
MASAAEHPRANGGHTGAAGFRFPDRPELISTTSSTAVAAPSNTADNATPSTPTLQQDGDASVMSSPRSVHSPPYWSGAGAAHAHHQRSISNMSVESIPAGAITLRDNETSDNDDRNSACWAKSVEVVDHTIINGSATNIGAFVVWIIKVETLGGSYMYIRKRYSEFDEFREQLIQSFPGFEAAMPPLPPKSVISKFRPRFLEKRRAGLQYFLNCILLNPEFSGSPVLKDFLFD